MVSFSYDALPVDDEHGATSFSSGEEDVERAVLGCCADGARVHGGLARAAQAKVPAREQQHGRLAAATRLARQRLGPAGRARAAAAVPGVVRGRQRRLEATRLRVLGLGLNAGRDRTSTTAG